MVVLLAMGVAWAVSPGDQGTEVADRPSVAADEEADQPPEDEATELEAVVAEIATFVEEERGLEFLEDPEVELLGEGDFQARLLEGREDDEEALLDAEDELRALGLIEDDVDLADALDELLGGAVLGFYDPEDGALVVRAGEITPLARITIAHELVHALDDQHFDLYRPEYDDDPTEVRSGFTALVEGSASVVEDAYRASLSSGERAEADAEELAQSGNIPDVPQILLEILSAPYVLGPDLVEAILDDGGQEALDAAFDDPPTTSEQYLFPDRYLAGEEAIEVPAPEAEGDIVYEGAFGALSLLLLTGDALAVDGWGGDAYVVWREDDRACARGTMIGDTDRDTDEIAAALEAWAADHDDAEVAPSAGGTVTFTACG